jgi:hypothetical protein
MSFEKLQKFRIQYERKSNMGESEVGKTTNCSNSNKLGCVDRQNQEADSCRSHCHRLCGKCVGVYVYHSYLSITYPIVAEA